ncbi:MAG TPA: MOSC N-terminal beta barrel domain-containing protein [Acidimicrobiales bacterium]|nr:MOSC N-terminal beta barrel domain-containing protein [Acidimicrobiales bacterium]
MRVAEIWRYPVKSLQGEPLETASVAASGLEGDRQWGLLDPATGYVLTARREARLLYASARLVDGAPVVTLDDGTVATDDATLSAWLGRPVQLVAAAGRVGRYEASLDRYRDDAPWTSWEGPPGSFHDSGQTQVSLVSRDSLGAWDRRRFRFNVVLDGGPDADLVGASLQIGSAALRVVKRISRCVMTTRPQPGGIERDLNVLRTIVADMDGCMGIGTLVTTPGTVRVGDEVAVGW